MGRYDNNILSSTGSLDTINKRRYYESLLDPTIPVDITDIYVMTTVGDRLDSLAWNYYADATLWWIISAANPDLRKDSLYLQPGMQIRIPADYQYVISLFQDQNTTR